MLKSLERLLDPLIIGLASMLENILRDTHPMAQVQGCKTTGLQNLNFAFS